MCRAEKFLIPALFLLAGALFSPSRAQLSVTDPVGTNAPASTAPTPAPATSISGLNSPLMINMPAAPGSEAVTAMLRDAFQLWAHGDQDGALDKANAAIKLAPQDPDAYGLRGGIYSERKLWDRAEKDYQTVLQLDSSNPPAKFNLAEIKFRQKMYDAARPGFLALEKDPDLGDLSTYKVFLCDLFGGHDDVAAKELAVFNQVGSNASYYFGNAAWSLYHHNIEEGRTWLISAVQIYAPTKVNLYATSLKELGYLPLLPPKH